MDNSILRNPPLLPCIVPSKVQNEFEFRDYPNASVFDVERDFVDAPTPRDLLLDEPVPVSADGHHAGDQVDRAEVAEDREHDLLGQVAQVCRGSEEEAADTHLGRVHREAGNEIV